MHPTPLALPRALRYGHPALVPPLDRDPAPDPPGGGVVPLRVTAERGPAVDEPVEGEVLDPVDPHGLLGAQVAGRLVGYSCRCGQWDAIVSGPSSAAWALRDHDRHRADARA